MGNDNLVKVTVAHLSYLGSGDDIYTFFGYVNTNAPINPPDDIASGGSCQPDIVNILGEERWIYYMYSADDGMSSITPFKVRFSPSIYVVGENEYLYIGRPDKNVILYSSNPRSTTFTYDKYLFFSGSDNNKTVDIYIGDVDPKWEGARYIKLN